jgi:GntR family transcriptional repressor for pyruvate dehydrogenase complex
MAALHGFTRSEMFEAREVLEVGAVALAARRATGEDLANVAEEMASMYASLTDPQTFLIHDIRFHQAVATASHNPILASLIEMVSAMFYERRRQNIGAPRDLRSAAEMHRVIYHALRDRDPDAARRAMSDHLAQSQAQSVDDLEKGDPVSSAASTDASATAEPTTGPRAGPATGPATPSTGPITGSTGGTTTRKPDA